MYDAIIIGGGPAGYETARLLSAGGFKTLIVVGGSPGGVCLNEGCIPIKLLSGVVSGRNFVTNNGGFFSGMDKPGYDYHEISSFIKNSIETASKGITFNLQQSGAEIVYGEASVKDPATVEVGGKIYATKNIIAATGSVNCTLVGVPDEALFDLRDLYLGGGLPESVVVAGGGYAGIEISFILASLGKNVHLVERNLYLLGDADNDIRNFVLRKIKKAGVKIHTHSQLLDIKKCGSGFTGRAADDDNYTDIKFDRIINCTGRRGTPFSAELGKLGVELDDLGFIKTDGELRTNIKSIFAVGDSVSDLPRLASTAPYQARMILSAFTGGSVRDIRELRALIPSTVFIDPPVSFFGVTERSAAESGIDFVVKKSFYKQSPLAGLYGSGDGFIKIVALKSGDVIGAHVAGCGSQEMIHTILAGGVVRGTPPFYAHPGFGELLNGLF